MKKYVSMLAGALLLLVVSQTSVFAQDGVTKGNFLLSPGLGFGYIYAGGGDRWRNREYAFTE